jgi:hypothetical protein
MNKNISRTNKKKNQIVIYWGKCRKSFYFRILFFSILSGIKIVSVNREWPPNKRDLYKLISDSRLLVSFDPLSNLCYESTLCRTPVFIIDNYINVNFTEYNIPLYFITTSLKKAIVYYKKGINIKEYQSIISIYNISTQNHLDIVKKFVVHLKAEIDALANQSIDEKKLIIDNISESDLISYKQLKNNGRFTKAKLSYQLPLFNSILALKLFNLNILSLLIEFSFFILRTDYILTNKIRTSISKHKSDLIENYLISTL